MAPKYEEKKKQVEPTAPPPEPTVPNTAPVRRVGLYKRDPNHKFDIRTF
jgi:hypothetical protein